MTPTIRVDDEVYALLQQRGEAFVDTPNTVLAPDPRALRLRREHRVIPSVAEAAAAARTGRAASSPSSSPTTC